MRHTDNELQPQEANALPAVTSTLEEEINRAERIADEALARMNEAIDKMQYREEIIPFVKDFADKAVHYMGLVVAAKNAGL